MWCHSVTPINKNPEGMDSLVVQWLRLHAPNAGGQGLITGPGTRSHMLQLQILHVSLKTDESTFCN